MSIVDKCIVKCKKAPQKIVFPDSLDTRLLLAANTLKSQGLAEPILIGNPFELRDYAIKNAIFMPNLAIVDPSSSCHFDQFVETYIDNSEKVVDRDIARDSMRNPLFYGAMMVKSGQADICISGNLSTTGDVLRAALKVIGVAEQHTTVSSFFMMSSPNGNEAYLFADASVVPEPTVEQLVDITIDTASSFQKLTGVTPRVAMLSFSTKGSSNHPAAQRVREAFERVRVKFPELIVDGELQFDAAVVPAVARIKSPDSPLHGDSNVLVFPTLDAGNIAYKVAQRLGHYRATGPLLQGLNKPMHDLSRGCSADDIVDIAVLASCMARL